MINYFCYIFLKKALILLDKKSLDKTTILF